MTQLANQTNATYADSGANGHSTLNDIFALSDEQILEIDPQPQDAAVRIDAQSEEGNPAPGLPAKAGSGPAAATDPTAAEGVPVETNANRSFTEHGARTDNVASTGAMSKVPFTSPDDIRTLAELYPDGITQAKSAAERARTLDEIDAAYFGATGNSPQQVSEGRAELAQRMLREDPAAFREMVFAGLRALEAANGSPATRSIADSHVALVGARLASPAAGAASVSTGGASPSPTALGQSVAQNAGARPDEHLTAYAEFEKAANADLEKTVGGAIERALHHALAHSERAESAALTARLSAAIRQDVEKALQGDRQLGEQVAQILAGRRFDNESRAQVVRLINDRAQQLVPVAAKRALHDWTQATLAAHRNSTARADAASSRREVAAAATAVPDRAPANQHSVARSFRGEASRAQPSTHNPRADARAAGNDRINYRKLSDEQILDL